MGRGQTDIQTYGHRDSMIKSAQWADSMKTENELFSLGGFPYMSSELTVKLQICNSFLQIIKEIWIGSILGCWLFVWLTPKVWH